MHSHQSHNVTFRRYNGGSTGISARRAWCAAVALALCCLVFMHSASAQSYVLSGTVRDVSTHELLPFVTVYIKGLALGTSTDDRGAFKLMLKSGSYDVLTSLVGYKTETRHVEIRDKNQVLDVRIVATDILLQEVTVYSSAPGQTSQADGGALSLQGRHITETTTVIPDVFRSVQTLPGISSDNEFSAKFNVRGGTPDENLVLVNGALVYEPFHVKEAPNASIGIFNTDMMRKVTLVTGGFSAKYGDRMSAVMDIEYREGSREQLQGAGTLSMTNFDLLLEGPMTSSGSFIVGARKSYVEYAMSLMGIDESIRPSFYDIQGVLAYSLSPKDKLQFEFIHAGDAFTLEPQSTLGGPFTYNGQYKGKQAAFRESSTSFEEESAHYISNLFDVQSTNFLSSTAFLKSEISYYEQIDEENSYNSNTFARDISSTPNYFYRSNQEHLYSNDLRIRTIELKSAFELQLTPYYELNCGVSYQSILFNQQLVDRRIIDENMNTTRYPDTTRTHRVDSAVDAANENIEARSFKLALYNEHVVQVNEKLLLNLGGRLDYFGVNRDLNLSPRLNVAYRFIDQTTLRAAWGFFYQSPIYRQLAYSAASDTNTKAQKAIHYLLGIEHVFLFDPGAGTSLTIKIEGFYKLYPNLISSSRTSSGRITYSRKNDASGSARGLDVYLAVSLARFYGWVSYGLLDAREDLLTDRIGEYPRFTDQRHTLSVVGEWDLGGRWSSNLRVQYGSGYAYTPSVSQFNTQKSQWEWIPGSKNSATLPAYRRVDIRLGKEFDVAGLFASAFFDVSNLFNFTNIQSYRYRFSSNGNPYVEEIKLWPILPTLGMTVKF
ncbi:MAG: TonB-dependent receptor [Ignavibacteriales bacterium]|nr:TonB-dependent receptor [Ignavibacteriales bacterium]